MIMFLHNSSINKKIILINLHFRLNILSHFVFALSMKIDLKKAAAHPEYICLFYGLVE